MMYVFNRLKACFSPQPINFARQNELDASRGICIIFMVFSHAFENISWFFDPDKSDHIYRTIDKVVGNSFGAPLFMLCMGISFSYSRHLSAKGILVRGAKMLGLAFFLETLRTAIPVGIEWLIYKDPETLEMVEYFFAADILPFAALMLLVFSLFLKLQLKPHIMLIISAFLCVLGKALAGIQTGSFWGDMAVGYIWRSHFTSFFPFLNWLIFPICGYLLGMLWVRIKNKDELFAIITPISIAISLIYYGSMVLVGKWYYLSDGNYYGMGLIDAIFTMISALAVIGIAFYINKYFIKLPAALKSLGRRLTSIYCIHWVLYGFFCLFATIILGDRYLPHWSVIPVGLIVLILSNFISLFYSKRLKGKKLFKSQR